MSCDHRYSLKLAKMSAPLVLLMSLRLDSYWMAALAALDIRLRILNHTAAELLGAVGRSRYSSYLILGGSISWCGSFKRMRRRYWFSMIAIPFPS